MWRADFNRNHIRPGRDDPVADSSQIQRVVSRVNSRMTPSVALQLKWAAGAPRSKNGVYYARDNYQFPQRGPTSRAGQSLPVHGQSSEIRFSPVPMNCEST
jgi:hypothetical protein